jgi:PAS domain S-box-containing protein
MSRSDRVSGADEGEVILLLNRNRRNVSWLLLLALLVVGFLFVHTFLDHPREMAMDPYGVLRNHPSEGLSFLLLATFLVVFRSLDRSIEALTRQGVKSREIMERSDDATLVVDAAGIVRFANPAADRFFNAESRPLTGRPFGHPLTGVGGAASVTTVGRSGAPRYGDMRVADLVWEGKAASVVTIRDETARRRAETRLAESDRRFQEVLETVSLIAVQLDPQGTLAYCNDYFLALTGYGREAVIGKNWFDTFVPGERAAEIRAVFLAVLADDPVARHHVNAIAVADGRKRTISWNSVVTYGLDGEPNGVTSIGVDITEELTAREALEASEARYRALFENMINGFAYHEVVTDDEGRPVDYVFLEINGAAEKFIGVPRGELIGRRVTEALPGVENDPTDWIGQFGAVALNGEPTTFQAYSAPLHRRFNVSAYSPRRGYFAVVFEDITERELGRRRLEWEMKVDVALAKLAHEILSFDGDELKPLLDLILESAQQLTESGIGFVGYLDEDTGFLVAPTMYGTVYEQCRMAHKTPVFENVGGLLGWVLKEKKPLLTNDPSDDPRSGGVPEGHIPITRFLGAPAMVGDRLVGELALANAARDYTERDLDVAVQLADLFALALDRFRNRQLLQNSESFMKHLMNTVPRPIAYRDLQGRFVQVNAACEEFLGGPAEDILGKTWADFLPPDEAAFARQWDVDVLEQAGARTYEAPFTLGGGPPRDILVTKAALSDAAGKPVGIVSVHHDITDIKRAEDTLRESVDRFRAIAENARMGIVHVDDEGTILYWNQASEAILGYTVDEAVGKKFYDLYATDDMRQTLREQMDKLREDGGGVPRSKEPLPMLAVRKDGAERLLEMSLAPFQVKGRWNVVGIFQDITERTRQEKMLEELFFAVEQSGYAALITDAQGRIEYANHRFVELTGVQPGMVFGLELCSALLKREDSNLCHAIQAAIRGGDSFRTDLEGSAISGWDDGRWFVLSAHPIRNRESELIGAHIMIEDITERRRWARSLELSNEKLLQTITRLGETRMQLIRSEKLASLGQLSAGVAHEIKNPLNIISMNAQLAKGVADVPAEVLEGLGVIEEQVIRAVKITENLREFARERKPEIVLVELRAFLENTIALVEYEMNVENLTVERRFGDEPVVIRGDPDQLAQVFLNVIGNARDAMNEKQRDYSYDELAAIGWKGSLTIDLRREDASVVVSFADTGVGVAPEVIGKVFDPFFTTKGEGGGTGLGLSIAYGIVENHGGGMEVESVPDTGTTVAIRLPLADDGERMGEWT